MRYLFLACFLAPLSFVAQSDTTTTESAPVEPTATAAIQSIQIEPNYTFDEGLTYDEDGEIITIKDAFTKIQMVEGTMYLTVFYNPSSVFRKKAIDEYVVASNFYFTDDGAISAIGNRLTVVVNDQGESEMQQESCKFIFFTNENKLVIESLVDDSIKFILTGQELPTEDELMKREQQIEKIRK